MNAPKSIVSGGTGYLGRFIAEELLAAGHDVTVMGRHAPPPKFFSQPVDFVRLSLETDAVTEVSFEAQDFFVHAAFDHAPGKYRGGEGDDPAGFRRLNLEGSVSLFKAAKVAGVKRAVFLSSRAVYGPRPPGTRLSECDEAQPDTLYGEVKLDAEQALAHLSGPGFQGVSLRVTGVYGPAGNSRRHKWAGLFEDFLAGRPIAPRAGTEVHGGDVAAAVRLVLEERQAIEPLNVSDILVDRRDILAIVKHETGTSSPLPAAADKSAVNAMRCDRLARLGWKPGGMALLEKTVEQLVRAIR